MQSGIFQISVKIPIPAEDALCLNPEADSGVVGRAFGRYSALGWKF